MEDEIIEPNEVPKEDNSIDIENLISEKFEAFKSEFAAAKTENEDLKNKVLENDIEKAILNSKYLDNSFMEFVKDTDIEKVQSKIKRLDNLIATTVGAEICKNGAFSPGAVSGAIGNESYKVPSYFIK